MKRFFAKSTSNSSTRSPSPSPIVHTPNLLPPKYVVPPLPQPNPHEYIAIVASHGGLLLRPHMPGLVPTESHVRIRWGLGGKIEEVQGDGNDETVDWTKSVIVYGLIGTLDLFSSSYLLVIASRTIIGTLFASERAVYSVKGVSAIPLTEERATMAINTLSSRNKSGPRLSLIVQREPEVTSLTPGPSDVLGPEGQRPDTTNHVKFAIQDDVKLLALAETSEQDESDAFSNSSGRSSPNSEVTSNAPVEKILANRFSFWNPLSKRSKSLDTSAKEDPKATEQTGDAKNRNFNLESVINEGDTEPAEVLHSIIAQAAPPSASQEEKHSELEEKIVRECIREFARGGMYFAYSFDITRSLQHKHVQCVKSQHQDVSLSDLNVSKSNSVDLLAEPSPTLPLWRRVDRQFWWNEWLSKHFIDAGLHGYVLPIMQGYYQISTFNIPREPVQGEMGDHAPVNYVIISRRSRDRAGLRYQRRGIGEEGHVANFVETETIMKVEREGHANVFSYVQIRGSIPLYWSQSGYGLKPAPQLSMERTQQQNADALRSHFQKSILRYGPHAVVNLAEQHGKEGAITQAYGDYVKEVDLPDVQYCIYDFHAETKGMKYENISKLVAKLERTFEAHGFFWVSNNTLMSEQHGVFRVNCIDCLDRTNVVESAFARYILDKQLGAVALLNPEESRHEGDRVLNDVWANNGDAISRAYAGTSALKGDFTRTGKRDIGGMLNDGVNSLARMYTSTFSDWFCQAVIDFMLGYRTLSVFSEFLLKLQSTDPRDLIRLSRIRAEAVATSVSRILTEGERLLSGWTFFSPVELNQKMGDKFEEKVVLLTATALYIIARIIFTSHACVSSFTTWQSYDYTLEKVKLFTRVLLGDIVQITKGAYILSPLEEASQDPVQNAGFIVSWLSHKHTTRVTSYSVRNSPEHRPTLPFDNGDRANISNHLAAVNTAGSTLSKLLKTAEPLPGSDTTFAAFKVLPIDPARSRRATGSFIEPADEMAGAKNCKEAVDMVVDSIVGACKAVGSGLTEDFVVEADIVSLAEAKRNTSVYAKMEYGVKRMLWLGG